MDRLLLRLVQLVASPEGCFHSREPSSEESGDRGCRQCVCRPLSERFPFHVSPSRGQVSFVSVTGPVWDCFLHFSAIATPTNKWPRGTRRPRHLSHSDSIAVTARERDVRPKSGTGARCCPPCRWSPSSGEEESGTWRTPVQQQQPAPLAQQQQQHGTTSANTTGGFSFHIFLQTRSLASGYSWLVSDDTLKPSTFTCMNQPNFLTIVQPFMFGSYGICFKSLESASSAFRSDSLGRHSCNLLIPWWYH